MGEFPVNNPKLFGARGRCPSFVTWQTPDSARTDHDRRTDRPTDRTELSVADVPVPALIPVPMYQCPSPFAHPKSKVRAAVHHLVGERRWREG